MSATKEVKKEAPVLKPKTEKKFSLTQNEIDTMAMWQHAIRNLQGIYAIYMENICLGRLGYKSEGLREFDLQGNTLIVKEYDVEEYQKYVEAKANAMKVEKE